MYTKQFVKLRLQRMARHLKSLGLLVWAPVAVLDVLLPLLLLFGMAKNGVTDVLKQTFQDCTRMLLPFFSVWWPLFLAREYLEADGNELLYVCKNRQKLGDFALPFLLYLLNAAVLFAAVLTVLFPDLWMEPLHILGACIWYFGLQYFLSYLTRSVTISLMALLLYTLANVLFPPNSPVFPMYYCAAQAEPMLLLRSSLPMAAGGLVLLGLGSLLNRKRLKFN